MKPIKTDSGNSAHLGSEASKRITALCHSIAHAQGLSEDVEHELCCHMEDKVLGYLSGDEVVSEMDAVLLAEHHFGDQEHVKALLAEVHSVEDDGHMARRLATVALVTLVTVACASIVEGTLVRMLLALAGNPDRFLVLTWWEWPKLLVACLTFAAMWHILRRIKGRFTDGFLPWSLPLMTATILFLLVLYPFLDRFRQAPWHAGYENASFGRPYQWIWGTIIILYIIANLSLWIWWCGMRASRAKSIFHAWAGFAAIASMIDLGSRLFDPNHAFRLSTPQLAAVNAQILISTAVAIPFAIGALALARRIAPGRRRIRLADE